MSPKTQEYLGIVSKAELSSIFVNQLKEPHDFIIYQLEGEQDYCVTYYRDIILQSHSIKKSVDQDRYRTIKARAKDVAEEFENDRELFKAYIAKGLRHIVGWDFDETLTRFHTWQKFPYSEEQQKNNLRFPEQTTSIIKQIAQRKDIVQVIMSNNFEDRIEHHVDLWFKTEEEGADPFFSIKGRESFHYTTQGNKEYCFVLCHRELNENSLVDEEGFLSLKSNENSYIDTVSCHLIDDDLKAEKRFLPFGIHVIKVNKNDNAHLVEIGKLLQLDSVPELTPLEPLSTASLLGKRWADSDQSPLHNDSEKKQKHDDKDNVEVKQSEHKSSTVLEY